MSQRLMIYDNTTITDGWDGPEKDALAYTWLAGGKLYRWCRYLDKVKGVGSWTEALNWMIEQGKKEPISHIQFWGHGSWGRVWIGKEALGRSTVYEESLIHEKWEELRQYLTGDALIWFRTCSTFGNKGGRAFAKEFTEWIGCKVAAHTHIIGLWQGGLHSLTPGQEPYWSAEEGIQLDSNGKEVSVWSKRNTFNSITCLTGHLPKGW